MRPGAYTLLGGASAARQGDPMTVLHCLITLASAGWLAGSSAPSLARVEPPPQACFGTADSAFDPVQDRAVAREDCRSRLVGTTERKLKRADAPARDDSRNRFVAVVCSTLGLAPRILTSVRPTPCPLRL